MKHPFRIVGLILLPLVICGWVALLAINENLDTFDPTDDRGQCRDAIAQATSDPPFVESETIETLQITPQQLVPISVSNARQVRELERIGRGYVRDAFWTEAGDFLVLTTVGMWWYRQGDFESDPQFLWDYESGYDFTVRDGMILDLSARGQSLAVSIRDVYTGEESAVVELESSTAGSWGQRTISSNHQMLAAVVDSDPAPSTVDSTIYVWDLNTGSQLAFLDEYVERVYSLAFSPDNTLLAVGGSNDSDENEDGYVGVLRLWNVDRGEELDSVQIEKAGVSSLAFSPDGNTLVSSDGRYSEDALRFWDVSTNTLRNVLEKQVTASSSDISFSPDGRRLAFGTQILDADTGEILATFDGYWSRITFSPDGATLAVIPDQYVYDRFSEAPPVPLSLYSTSTFRRLATLQHYGHLGDRAVVEFDSENRLLIGRSSDRVRTFQPQPMVFSPDGSRGVLASSYGSEGPYFIRLCDVANGRQITTIGGSVFAFSPDSTMLATSDLCGLVELYDSDSGSLMKTLENCISGKSTRIIEFSPDGSIVALGSQNYNTLEYSIELWNIQTQSLINDLRGHSLATFSLEFSPDGKLLVSSSADGTIRLWGIPDA